MIGQYKSGLKPILPADIALDMGFVETIKQKNKETNRRFSDKIVKLLEHYSVAEEIEDPSDTVTLKQRIKKGWEYIREWNPEEDLRNADIIGTARNLVYVNGQRNPNSYRDIESLTAPRLLENQRELPELMNRVIFEFNEIKDKPILRAAYINFAVYYYQPARNGNKRLGQLIAARTLDASGFPVPFIPVEEFNRYTKLINNACMEFDGKIYDCYMKKYAEYYLGRINTSLDLVKESTGIVERD